MDPYLVIPKQDCQGQHLILNSPLLISPFSPTPETWLHIAPCSWGAKLLILVEGNTYQTLTCSEAPGDLVKNADSDFFGGGTCDSAFLRSS